MYQRDADLSSVYSDSTLRGAIRSNPAAYDFAEWFAAETMKTAWVWLCVFSEMDTSGKLEKHKREGRRRTAHPRG